MMNRQNLLAAAIAAALLPTVAMAHQGARVTVGGIYQHISLAGAGGNLSGVTLGIEGVSRHLDGVGVRARLGYATGDGASLETLGVRLVAYPHQGISPYMSAGAVDLSRLPGATSATASYQVNTSTGAITATPTITHLPPVGVVMGDAFVGLRGRYDINPHLVLAAHAALGEGIGGAVTGLAPQASGSSTLATSFGAAMSYRLSGGADLSLGYSYESIPVRGATFKSGGVIVSAARRFF